jgi:MinD superfamily P-loop ATPase
MKKTILGLMIGLSIANADLLSISVEAPTQMTWSDAKRFCTTVDNLSSFTVICTRKSEIAK